MVLSRSPTNAGHTFTFTTNYRGQIYHGVLTDGSSPHIHNSQIQKRFETFLGAKSYVFILERRQRRRKRLRMIRMRSVRSPPSLGDRKGVE